MKIEKIKKLNSGKYTLVLDNNEKITTYDEVILKHNLLFNKDLTNEKLNEIIIATNYYNIYSKVIKYISIKMRSEKEIIYYLNKLQIDKRDQNQIIDELKKQGFINENIYIKAFISDKVYLSSNGPHKIKNELLRHDVEEHLIDNELSNIEKNIFYDKLQKLMIKKIKSNSKYSNYILKQKLFNYFCDLGYEKEMILEIFEQQMKNDNSIINKEYQLIYKKLSKKYEGSELQFKIKNKLYQKGFSKDEIDQIKMD